MTLDSFLNTQPPTLRVQLQQVLDRLSSNEGTGLTRQFVFNIKLECRLRDNDWDEIVRMLLTAAVDIQGIASNVTTASRKSILQGGSIPTPWPTYFGRAVTKEQFCQTLKDRNFAASISQAKGFLTRMTKKDVKQTQNGLQRLSLGDYVIWATFHPKKQFGKPFDTLPSHADGIRNRLGLIEQEKGQDLVLFIYSLPPGIEPLFPTIADACAGEPWNYYFRPTAETQLSGFTMPWVGDDKPCPEIVHRSVYGNMLVEPLKIITN